MGGTEASVGVGGAVGLSLEELIRAELVQGLAVLAEGEHVVVHLAGQTMPDAGTRDQKGRLATVRS